MTKYRIAVILTYIALSVAVPRSFGFVKQSGGNQAYQTWTPGSLRRVRFMDKVGAGERVGIKSLKINKKARWV